MIITCPHCQTKYQVTYEAIGSAGRKVQCAHCNRAWQQEPLAPEPPPTDPITEDALDEAIATEAEAVAAERADLAETEPPPPPAPAEPDPGKRAKPLDVAEIKKRQKAFTRRQNVMASRLPYARTRRAARVLGMLTLVTLVAGGYLARIDIVERYPDLAGLYEAIGLGVNVVGLDFDKLATLESLDQGSSVLDVSAQIVGLRNQPVRVPPVVISLLDDSGKAVYEWSVSPKVPDLMAGERATFDTRLSLPPTDATHVRLSFVGYGSTPLAQGVTGAGDHAADAHGAAPEDPHAAADPSHEAPAAADHGAPAADHAAPAAAHGEAAPAADHGADHAAPAADHAAPAEEAGHGEAPAHAPAEASPDHAGDASPAAPTHH